MRKFLPSIIQKFFHSPILRPVKPQSLIPAANFSSFSDNAQDNSILFNEVITVINSVHPIRPALGILFPILNREVVVSVLQSQAKLKEDPRICFEFFIWSTAIPRFRSGASHKVIVDVLLSSGDSNSFDLYWSVLDELRNRKIPIPADAFVVLILAHWRLGEPEKAVETFGRMEAYECEPNLAAYNVLLTVLVNKGVISLALAIYNKLMKSSCGIDCSTYNILIDGLCKKGMIEATLKLFDEMTEGGISPSRITYTIIISGLCKAKKSHDAYKLFKLMKENGCQPDVTTFSALLDGFCKCGQIDEALKLFELFINEGYRPGIHGYSSLVDGLLRAKRISEAEKLFQKVFEVGLVPDVVLYTIMLHGLCESGKLKEATNMLQDMIGKGVMPDTKCYNVLIKGFCDAGLLDQARSLKLEISMHNQFPDTYTYTILICGLCRNGLLGDAQQIFNDMGKLGCSPSVVTFNALIDGLCKMGKFEDAHLMRYKMEIGKNPSLFLRLSQSAHRIFDSTSLQKMVENLVDSGEVLKAYKLLNQLADHSNVVPDITTYNCLINGLCKAGQINGALKLFEELQLKGHVPDSITYGTIIHGLQNVGREEDAFKLFEQMNEIKCKPSASVYSTLMTWSCRRQKTSVAYGLWLRYLRGLPGREGEALKLSEECFQKGDFVEAVRTLLELDVKLADLDSSHYNIWLVGLCQVNRVEDALKTFSLLEEFNVAVSAPGCATLIRALCEEGNIDRAVDVFLYSMEKGYLLRRKICNKLLEHLLNSKGKHMVAVELVDRMKSVGYNLNSTLYLRTRSPLIQCSSHVQDGEGGWIAHL